MNVKNSSGIGEAAARCGVVRKGIRMKEKLTNIWLWSVDVAFTVAAICTFAAWVVGLTICRGCKRRGLDLDELERHSRTLLN